MISRLVVFFTCISLASCTLEPCKDKACGNGRAVEDFDQCICLCDRGWTGEFCNIENKCVTRNVTCQDGDCSPSTGLCICKTGYEGDSCNILSREKFLNGGNESLWTATDTCGLEIKFHEPRLQGSSLQTALEIDSFYNDPAHVLVVVDVKEDGFTQRGVADFSTFQIADLKGTISGDRNHISVTYRFTQGLSSNCRGTWVRQ